jgi:hypothetical protein
VASNTKQTQTRRANRHKNLGKRRKAKEGRRSTVSDQELFAGCGEPGQPAPKAS